MKATAAQVEEQREVKAIYEDFHKFMIAQFDVEGRAITLVLFVLEQEIYRLRRVILDMSEMAAGPEPELEGMYR